MPSAATFNWSSSTNSVCQPPRSNPPSRSSSGLLGPCITPSRVRNSVTTILRIGLFASVVIVFVVMLDDRRCCDRLRPLERTTALPLAPLDVLVHALFLVTHAREMLLLGHDSTSLSSPFPRSATRAASQNIDESRALHRPTLPRMRLAGPGHHSSASTAL